MTRRPAALGVLLAAATVVAGACAAPGPPGPGADGAATEAPAPHRTIAAPPAEYGSAAWLPDGTVVADAAPPAAGNDVRPPVTVLVLGGDGSARPLPLPALPGCAVTDHRVAGTVPDGRLALRVDCFTGAPGDAGRSVAAAVDPRRPDAVAVLAPLPDTPVAVAWRPDLRHGMVGSTLGPCAGLAALGPDGPVPAPGPTALGGRAWRLDLPLLAPDGDCPGGGTARVGGFADAGRTALFWASAAAVDVVGPARRDAPSTLFAGPAVDDGRLVDPGGVRALPVDGVVDPSPVTTSTDGRLVAFTGTLGARGRGLWLLDRTTGAVRLLGAGRLSGPSFGPGDREVLATRRASADAGVTTVEAYCAVGGCAG